MPGIIELEKLLNTMNPTLVAGEYIFCTVPGDLAEFIHLNPVASFVEREGLTLILPKMSADL